MIQPAPATNLQRAFAMDATSPDPFRHENLLHDPLHGYLPFVASAVEADEVPERSIIDNPWVQRLRQIHQLQTAWLVFPSAEHSRFQHVLGAMHLGTRVMRHWDASLRATCPDAPSRAYVELLIRISALLHDVGHGPFGHFFDQHFLAQFGLTHESLGAMIIEGPLRDELRRLRATPSGRIGADEVLDASHIAFLIQRPRQDKEPSAPRWLQFLRSLFCGVYTVDNMDFVLRDAYMAGFHTRSFDVERLVHYSYFTPRGLTIHARGMDALLRFQAARSELFRSLYFHRTVRAIDLELADLFRDGSQYLFPGDPSQQLDRYREFTEWSLLVDVTRWPHSSDPRQRELGMRWQRLWSRQLRWKMICERTVVFGPSDAERASLTSNARLLELQLRERLPRRLTDLSLRVDVARQLHRPHTHGPAAGHNFLYDPARNQIRPLDAHDLYRRLPIAQRLCRVYAESTEHATEISRALDDILGDAVVDDATNM